MAKARKPPATMSKVSELRKVLAVIVAPTVNPKKMVAAFIMVSEAALNKRLVSVPISLIRLPNSNMPTKGTEEGTSNATIVPNTMGKIILRVRIFLISILLGYNFSCSFILIPNSLFDTVYFTNQEAAALGIIGGADGPTAIYTAIVLAPRLLGPIAIAAYSYMALVPVIIPLVVKYTVSKLSLIHISEPTRPY